MAITTEYDAKVNLTIAKEALALGKKRKDITPAELARLERHVKDAEAILARIKTELKNSRKK